MTIRELLETIKETLQNSKETRTSIWNDILDFEISSIPAILWELILIIGAVLAFGLVAGLLVMLPALVAKITIDKLLPTDYLMPLLRKSLVGRLYNNTLHKTSPFHSFLSHSYLAILFMQFLFLAGSIFAIVLISFFGPLSIEIWVLTILFPNF